MLQCHLIDSLQVEFYNDPNNPSLVEYQQNREFSVPHVVFHAEICYYDFDFLQYWLKEDTHS
jgi:hypothetical protein